MALKPIDLSNDRVTIATKTIENAGLAAKKNESLFFREGKLVEILGKRLITVDKGNALISWLLENEVSFEKTGRNGTTSEFLPLDIANMLVSRTTPWGDVLQHLNSISEVPYVLQDGSIITKKGYYPEMNLYNVVEKDLLTQDLTGMTCSQESAQLALKWLYDEIFVDFPFVSPADRANAIAAPLALLTRYVHKDTLPLWGISAREAGTGKGYLNKVIRTLITSSVQSVFSLPDSETELQKVIGSILSNTSTPVVSWDNVERGSTITSGTLCRLHTGESVATRTLGKSEIPSGVNDRLWIADGNNIRPGEDMVRRYIEVSMDSQEKDPALVGKGWHHADLISVINANRATVIEQFAIIIKAWFDAGQPSPKKTPNVESYNELIRVVGGALEYAGEENFWGNLEEVQSRAVSGSDNETNYDFLKWLAECDGVNEYKISSHKVIAAIQEYEEKLIEGTFKSVDIRHMKTPVPPEVAREWNGGESSRSRAMGKYLTAVEGSRYGANGATYMIVPIPLRTANRKHWKLVLEVSGSTGWKNLSQRAELGKDDR